MRERMDSQNKNQLDRGFTLIEVTLSMGFIAFIITILAATTVNIVRTYTKGMWLSQVNSAGQQIIADMGTTARYNTPPTMNSGKQRLCFDNVVYAWNTSDDLDSSSGTKNVYNGQRYSMLRIESPTGKGRVLCDSTGDNLDGLSTGNYKVSVVMGRGVRLMAVSVKQSDSKPLLEVKLTASTNGDNNKPYLSYTGRDGTMKTLTGSNLRRYYNGEYTPSDPAEGETPTWRCGDMIGGVFTPSSNQYCAFASYDVIMYERSIRQ